MWSKYPLARTKPGYTTPQEAEASALEMLYLYRRWEQAGRIRIVVGVKSLEEHIRRFPDGRIPGFLIAIEGADPIVTPDDLPAWFDQGVRMVGLAWGSVGRSLRVGILSIAAPTELWARF